MKELGGCVLLLLGLLAVAAIVAAAIAHMRREANHGSSGALGAAMLEVQSLIEPGKRHVVEEVRADRQAGDEVPGDPPEKEPRNFP